jgi:hypothetical protein
LTIIMLGVALGLAARLVVQAYASIVAEIAPAAASQSPGAK